MRGWVRWRAAYSRYGGVAAALPVLSVFDAVDGSSTGTSSAMDVGAVEAPTIQRSEPCRR